MPDHPEQAAAPAADASATPVPSAPAVIAVTVLGDDRPGIVADVTAAVADVGGNLEDSTMTLLRGHFAMVVLVRTDRSAGDVERALAPLSADGALVVDVRELPERSSALTAGSGWTVHVNGADRPGIVAAITRVVADHGGNIVDLGTRLGRGLYVLTLELVLPSAASPEALAADLDRVSAGLDVTVHLTPVDDEVL